MLNVSYRTAVSLLVVFFSLPTISLADHVKQVSGWVEKVSIGDPPITIRAKIDTGAEHSSLPARDYELYKKGAVEWVRFTLNNKEGDTLIVEKPVKRFTQIKQKDNRPSIKRPVIELGVCMGNVYKIVQVNLADREKFNFPMLIGRSFLQGSFVVDADHKYVNEPDCKH